MRAKTTPESGTLCIAASITPFLSLKLALMLLLLQLLQLLETGLCSQFTVSIDVIQSSLCCEFYVTGKCYIDAVLDQELISHRYSSCCSCWGDLFT